MHFAAIIACLLSVKLVCSGTAVVACKFVPVLFAVCKAAAFVSKYMYTGQISYHCTGYAKNVGPLRFKAYKFSGPTFLHYPVVQQG